MNVLIVSQVFWPENFKINDFATELVKRGHNVTVITGKPNYPAGKFYKGYNFFTRSKEVYNGVIVYRVPIIPRGSGSGLKLSLNYLSFVLFGSIFALFHRTKYDFSFVFAVSPITSAIPAIVHKWIYKTKLNLWVLDLWPESVNVTGKMKLSVLFNILNSIVRFIYKNSDNIFISSNTMRDCIIKKTNINYDSKIHYMPNWAEDEFLNTNVDKNKYLSLMPDGFKLMFAGNIGFGQDVPSIVEAAKILKPLKNIKIIFIGNGSDKDYLLSSIKKFELEDTIFYLGSFPIEEMGNLYFHADMMLLTLKDFFIYSITVPGKLQGYLASKKPVAAMINGEAADLIEKSNCGFAVPAEDYKQFAIQLKKIYMQPQPYFEKMKLTGFEFYQKTFNKSKIISDFIDVVNNV